MALDAKKDAEKFGELFERLVEDLTSDDAANPEITEAANRFKEVCSIGEIFQVHHQYLRISSGCPLAICSL